jgi:hypothetical protein
MERVGPRPSAVDGDGPRRSWTGHGGARHRAQMTPGPMQSGWMGSGYSTQPAPREVYDPCMYWKYWSPPYLSLAHRY